MTAHVTGYAVPFAVVQDAISTHLWQRWGLVRSPAQLAALARDYPLRRHAVAAALLRVVAGAPRPPAITVRGPDGRAYPRPR